MTTYFTFSFPLCGVTCEASARMVTEQKDDHVTQHYFVVTIGDYIMAKWVPNGPLSFENRSGANYHESNVLCQLNEAHMRSLVLPVLFSQLCPEGLTLIKPPSPLPANTEWFVAPGEIDALPRNIRSYVHQLEARADPAGDVQRIAALEQQVKGLTARLASEKRQELVTLTAAALTGLCAKPSTERQYEDTLAAQAASIAHKTLGFI